MSFIIVPNVGERRLLTHIGASFNNEQPLITCRLFTNNLTLGENTIRADFVAPTNPGYSIQNLTDWNAAELTPDAEAYMTHPEITFTVTGGSPVTCYGYLVTNEDDDLLWCQKFDNPRTLSTTSPITFGLIFKLRQIPIS